MGRFIRTRNRSESQPRNLAKSGIRCKVARAAEAGNIGVALIRHHVDWLVNKNSAEKSPVRIAAPSVRAGGSWMIHTGRIALDTPWSWCTQRYRTGRFESAEDVRGEVIPRIVEENDSPHSPIFHGKYL